MLAGMLVLLIGQRLIRAAAERRRNQLLARYRPIVDAALSGGSPEAVDAAAAIPQRHRELAAELVLATLRIVRGSQNERARTLAARLDLTAQWHSDLSSRLWWRRSEAALALGL